MGKTAQQIKALAMQTCWPAISPRSHVKVEDKGRQDGSVGKGPCH